MWTPPEDTSDLFISDLPYSGSYAPIIGDTWQGDYVGFVFEYDEHESLLLDCLGCTYNGLLIDQIPQYPMIARMQDHYDDYQYAPQEAITLRSECMTVAQTCTHEPAFRALRKLIYICEASIEKDTGFWLICD